MWGKGSGRTKGLQNKIRGEGEEERAAERGEGGVGER